MLFLLVGCTTTPAPADLVVVADKIVEVSQGRIRSVHDADSQSPIALGVSTKVLKAKYVTAGFVDAHGHPDGLGAHLAELDLSNAQSYAEALARVAAVPVGTSWLVGRGWDQNDWKDAPAGGWPLASDLEKVAPGRKIILSRVDGHAVWVSPAVLREQNIVRETLDPADGRIVRDETGAPTGVLIDGATTLAPTPLPSAAEERRRLQAALVLIAAKGLTGVHVMGVGDATLALMEALDTEGRLPIRLWVYVQPDTEAAKRLWSTGPWSGDRLKVVGIKAIADGALGSRGAELTEPYQDDPTTHGTEHISADALRELAVRTLGAGAGLAVHAIGDKAVHETLDAFEAARKAHPDKIEIPLRVEHAQVVAPADVPRFASLHVIASMQPTHATSDAPWAEDRLGPVRIGWAYAWRTLSDAGAVLAFGSDFPLESVDPALGIAAGTTRGGWHVEQALTLPETIAAFTSGAARAVGEAELGALEPGKKADLTLWTDDGAGNWRAIATVVGGEVVAGSSP